MVLNNVCALILAKKKNDRCNHCKFRCFNGNIPLFNEINNDCSDHFFSSSFLRYSLVITNMIYKKRQKKSLFSQDNDFFFEISLKLYCKIS